MLSEDTRSLAEEEHDSFKAWIDVAPHVGPDLTQAQKTKFAALFRHGVRSLDPVRAARRRGLIRALSM